MAAFFMSEGGPIHLTHGGFRADHHSAAPPDLLSGVTALGGETNRSRLAHTMALAPCAEAVTDTHLVIAGKRAAQR
ncbi:hypothetical protein PVK74_10665 [Micromonospora chalcea]|uniref:hypothetical protein n=1 Tax=Micromonospora chalcea TaxID=1874 RepID=UPI002379C367|nr:hypothetical protein [Micromonospora chalcea]WDQ02237.1 hypothetical protein PVK74_10665 [Micromonospora chalcea]